MNSKQENTETVENQILHAKLHGIGKKEGYSENVCGTFKNIKEYCDNNSFKVGHYYNYSDLQTTPGGGYFRHIES
jgi:hypothetical protein